MYQLATLIILLLVLVYFLIYLPIHHKNHRKPDKIVSNREPFQDASSESEMRGHSLVEGVVKRSLQKYLADNCDCVNQHGTQFSEKFTYYWRNKLRQHEKEYCDYLSKLSSHDRARYLYQWLSTQIYHAPPCTQLMTQ